MNAYVLTQMEMVGEGEQAHVVTRNRSVTFDPATAEAWAKQGVDYDFEALPLPPHESASLGVSQQALQALQDATAAAKELGEAADEASRFLREIK